jgi:purine nucleosidase
MVVRKVLMDVDTGLDDAIAIVLALQSPEIEILGITTVGGNVTARIAALNTLRILRVMDKESKIPVLIGASRPLSRTWKKRSWEYSPSVRSGFPAKKRYF